MREWNQIEKRNLVSSFFVTLLIGIAFQEMVSTVRESVRSTGLSMETCLLVLAFFMNAMRFFIGNIIHLISSSLEKMPGMLWFYDLIIITIQSMIIIFTGGLCSVESNLLTTIGFYPLLILLYLIDTLWIVSQWLIGLAAPTWRRHRVPWEWALLNAFSAICLGLAALLLNDWYAMTGILILFVVSLVGFVADVFLVDHSGILK